MRTRCLGCMSEYESEYGICPFCGYDPQETPENSLHMKPGELLYGRYLIGKALGSGGFGITYVGWDFTMARKVAIKEYLPSEFATRALGETQVTIYSGNKGEQYQSGLEKFVEEAQRLSKFQDIDGVVQVYDAFKENNTAYIVMEFLDGETLASYLEHNGKIPVDEAVEMLKPAMYALESVHKAGIIHRDIAPDNIFLTKDGNVKVIDFGASRYATTSHSRSLTVMIKQGYSPEEQYRSRGDQGPHTDVYALGAVLYKMVTGITPPDAMERRAYFESENKDVLMPPSKNCKIDRNRENAILNAMNVRIEDRTKTIADFLGELESDKPVKRVSGKIRAFDRMRWPLWAKIGIPVAGAAALVLLFLLLTGKIGVVDTLNRAAVLGENHVRVADVTNQSLGVAQALLYEDGIESVAAEYLPYDNIATNIVIEQDYSAGTVLEKGSVVSLYLSNQTEILQGAEEGVMPSVLYQSLEEAETLLEEAGIPYYVTEVDSQYAEGTVIWASLLEGDTAGENETVELVVSTGEEDTESMSVNLPATSLYVGDSIQLVAENASGTSQWSSSDETVAVVDQEGRITAQGEGTAIITVVSGSEKAACYLSVYDYSIQIKTESIGIFTEGTATVTVYGAPGGTTFDWSSSDEAVAEVKNGAITGVADGEALVTANCTIDGRTYTTDPVQVNVSSNGIILSAYDISGFYVGDQVELTTETKTEAQEVQWESDNPDVASVQNGLITAVGEGTAQITAKIGEYEAVCSVTVTEPRVKISASQNSLPIDDELVLNVTTLPTNQEVSWSSSDTSICTVDGNGTVTAVTAGKAAITAEFTYQGAKYSSQYEIIVTERITLSPSSLSMKISESEKLEAVTESSDQTVAWSSSDSGIVTVSDNGTVTAVGEGTAVVTAEVKASGKSYTATTKVQVAAPTIGLSTLAVTMKIGQTSQLKASVDPDSLSVTWSSADESVATVSSAGLVTGVGAGSTTITASITVNGKKYASSCTVTVGVPTITLSATSATVTIDGSTSLSAVTDPSGLSVTWSSSSTSVATVSSSGTVTGVAAGTATITATITVNGKNYTSSCKVTVTAVSITLSGSTMSLYEGDSGLLSATVSPSGQSVTWSSSNTSVATVSTSGSVTGVAAGTATITAKMTVNGKSYTASCEVTVKAATLTLSSSSLSLYAGDTGTLSATTSPSGQSVTWSSSNTNVATVSSSGVVTGVGGGTATITASFTLNGIRYATSSCEVTVTAPAIAISSSSLSLYVGNTGALSASTTPSGQSVTWSSSNTGVATVSTSGTVTGVAAGTAAITASMTVNGKSYTSSCQVTVTAPAITISSSSLSLYAGNTGTLSATTSPSGQSVTWSSSNTSVATVTSSGTVTGVASGTATITAQMTVYGKSYSSTCTVTVSSMSISISSSSLSMKVGDMSTLTASVSPSDQTVTWSSSNTDVATVSTFGGVVTAIAEGSATITATISGTSYSASCVVSVAAAESTLQFTGMKVPSGNISFGSVTVSGKVSSNYNLYSITYSLDDTSGTVECQTLVTGVIMPADAKTYNLTDTICSMFDYVTYASTFTISFTATDESGKSVTYASTFTIS